MRTHVLVPRRNAPAARPFGAGLFGDFDRFFDEFLGGVGFPVSRAATPAAVAPRMDYAETEDRIAGTTLEGWPVLPVAAPDGTGLEALRTALTEALDRSGAAADIGIPRMWIDRAFTIEGAGLVVTGTLVDGTIAADDAIEIWNRGRQTHPRSIGSANAHACAVVGSDGSRGESALARAMEDPRWSPGRAPSLPGDTRWRRSPRESCLETSLR